MRKPFGPVAIIMLSTSSGILSEIIRHKRLEVEDLRPHAAELERRAYERTSPPRAFGAALRTGGPAIIAEVKQASPSKGLFQANFDPRSIAMAYQAGRADCISVLTDARYFGGSLADLESARAAVSLPAIRKDFTVDRLCVFEAAAHGADAILLLASVLSVRELRDYRKLASTLAMTSLVEVHDEHELKDAIDSGAEVIGVNNRNLDTFEVTLDTSLRLSERIPANVTRVSESGIRTRADIQRLSDAGFHAFLIGETLMRATNPVDCLMGLKRR